MESYYFILGRENKISQKELECILASFGFCLSGDTIILSDEVLESKLGASADEIAGLMNILGGTVKIYQKIAPGGTKVVELLKKENISKKVIFGISNYSKSQVDTFRTALEAKKSLRIPLRVVAGKENDRLSSAQSFQYKMDRENIEYGLFDTGIGKLIAVQNINEWTRHDYGKPRSDAKSGMLPPKLARMMVNLAVSSSGLNHPLVVDPFCGSGNILIEALTVGCDIVGSDVSDKAVEDTRTNVDWAISNFQFPISKQISNHKSQISKNDATKFNFGKINRDFVVVTEPFLGQPRRAKLRIEEEKQAKEEATKLCLDFLKNLKLTTNSSQPARNASHNEAGGLKAIAMVFPLYELANGKKLSIFNQCVDFIRDFGYTLVCPPGLKLGETSSKDLAGPPLEYGRDYQVVKRQIVLLKLSA